MSDNEPAEVGKGKTKTAARKTIFVISPIGSTGTAEHRRYRNTLEYIVKKAFHAPDYAVVRADEETSPDSITTQVIGRIVESDLIIADLTDHNPNVFYELAVAHGYQKPVIHMMQLGQTVPFDVGDQRVIFYDLTDPESVDKARSGLIASAEWLEASTVQARNPLTAYGQFSAISNASGGGEGGEAVASAIATLSRQIAQIEGRLSWRGSTIVPASRKRDSTPTETEIANLLGATAYSSRQTGDGPVTISFESYRKKISPELIDAITVVAADGGFDASVTLRDDGQFSVELVNARD